MEVLVVVFMILGALLIGLVVGNRIGRVGK